MDEVFGRVSGKYKISLADSTMMLIVHRAMDKAHDRAQRREGAIECLTAISMFYELAVMQLEGCLKFLQEESDQCCFESSDEEVLGSDLAEIRDRLMGRLKDVELAISEKDKELAYRLENELMLKKALEKKEKELNSLRVEGPEGLGLGNNQIGVDEDRDGEFSGLKHSVDQQVWSIKQKLEPESKLLDRRRNRSCDNFSIELMGIDIDMLKETMDIAFGKMQSAIFSSEMEPVEQQWTWKIEKDALSILIKGFMRDFQSEFQQQEKQISTHLSASLREMKCLHHELQTLCLFESNQDDKISLKLIGKSFSEKNNQHNQQEDEDDLEDDGGNLVAKMIKNHESIIKKKSKEVNWEKREITGERRGSYPWGEEDSISSRRRMQDVITRMERLIYQTEKFRKTFSHCECDEKGKGSLIKRLHNFHKRQEEEDSQEKVSKTSISDEVYEAFHGEVKILKEKEEASLQTMIMKKTCATLLKGLISDSSNEKVKMANKLNEQMDSHKVDLRIREEIQYMVFQEVLKNYFSAEICSLKYQQHLGEELREEITKVYFTQMCKEWNGKVERYSTENLIREEIYQIALEGCLKDIAETTNCVVTKFKDSILEGKLREVVSTFLIRELLKDWKEVTETQDTELIIYEKIYKIALEESLKDVPKQSNRLVSKHNEVKHLTNCIYGFGFQCLEHSIKEDICKILFEETYQGWKKDIDVYNFESLIQEEVFLLVVSESVKEASFEYKNTTAQDNHFEIFEEFTSLNMSNRSREVHKGDLWTGKQDLELNYIEVEQGLIQTPSSEFTKDGLIHLKQEESNKIKISRELLSKMGSTCKSISNKVMNALDHLVMSKALANEFRSCLLVAVEGVERFDDQKCSLSSGKKIRKPSSLQNKAIKGVKVGDPSCSTFIPIIEFLEVFMEFKSRVEESLELNIIKMEGAIHDLNPLAKVVARLRRQKWLYQKGFLNRCENLKKAEAEVDLLGNQVEVLLDLLQKIYNILHHYSPVLQKYFEVRDILKMIRKELAGEF